MASSKVVSEVTQQANELVLKALKDAACADLMVLMNHLKKEQDDLASAMQASAARVAQLQERLKQRKEKLEQDIAAYSTM